MQAQAGKLIGHVVRVSPTVPVRQVAFKITSLELTHTDTKRVGRPRESWVLHNLDLAWGRIRTLPHERYEHTEDQRNRLQEAYKHRRIP